MKHISSIGLGLLSAFCLMTPATFASDAHNHKAQVKSKPYLKPYLKPGAAVTFDHDFAGQVEPGGTGRFKLIMNEDYSDGLMSIAVNAKGTSLDLTSGSQTAQFDMTSEQSHEMDIQFRAPDQGRYYVNVLATVEHEGRMAHRSYAVPIQVGSPSLNARSKTSLNMRVLPSGERVILMQAQETINGVRQ